MGKEREDDGKESRGMGRKQLENTSKREVSKISGRTEIRKLGRSG